MSQQVACPACGAPTSVSSAALTINALFCPECGPYQVSLPLHAALLSRGPDYKLAAFLKEYSIRNEAQVLLVAPQDSNGAAPNAISIDAAINRFPTTMKERIDRTIANIAGLAGRPGQWVRLVLDKDYPVGFAADGDDFKFILEEMESMGLITHREPITGPYEVRPTANGWDYAEQVEAARSGPPRKIGFQI